MSRSYERLSKLSLAILGSFMESNLGVQLVDEGRKQNVEAFTKALQNTEERFINEYADRQLAQMLLTPRITESELRLLKVVTEYYVQPTNPTFADVLKEILIGKFIYVPPGQIRDAVDFFMRILTEELALVDQLFRANLYPFTEPELPSGQKLPIQDKQRQRLFVAYIIGLTIIMLVALFTAFIMQTSSRIVYQLPTSTLEAVPIMESPTLSLSTLPNKTPNSISPTAIPAYYYEANLIGFGNYKPEALQPGSMNFEYPVYLLPNSSDVVTLTITLNLDVGSNLPNIFQRIPIPVNAPLQIDEYFNYSTNILVAPQMRVTLTSAGITIIPQSSNSKKNLYDEPSTLWSWIIKTPAEVGTHPLYLSIFLGDNPEPIWSYSFTVSVAYPTDTPLPTATNSLTPTFNSHANS